jgi:sirohydrochlorin ferrochelatase
MENIKTEAVIILGHGSGTSGAGDDMERIAGILSERFAYRIVEICYLSRQEPSFPEAFDKCITRGAKRIIVIPYFLHAGIHILKDIPEMVKEKAMQYPHAEVVIGRHLGFDECLVELVRKRAEEARHLPGIRDAR